MYDKLLAATMNSPWVLVHLQCTVGEGGPPVSGAAVRAHLLEARLLQALCVQAELTVESMHEYVIGVAEEQRMQNSSTACLAGDVDQRAMRTTAKQSGKKMLQHQQATAQVRHSKMLMHFCCTLLLAQVVFAQCAHVHTHTHPRTHIPGVHWGMHSFS